VAHGAATDAGHVRDHNEDAFGVDQDRLVFVVADGLGGHQAGEVASAVATSRFLQVMAEPMRPEAHPVDVLSSGVMAAHVAVKQATAAAPGRQGMGTTIVASWFPGPGPTVWLVNVGDSRGFLLRDGALSQLSVDHTALEELRRAGALPEDPAQWPPRQQLTQALGPSDHIEPHITSRTVNPGDQVLLCSDGLTDLVAEREIAAILMAADPQSACEGLVEAANRAGGIDNITVVVAKTADGSTR
jgi:protein phosphatase